MNFYNWYSGSLLVAYTKDIRNNWVTIWLRCKTSFWQMGLKRPWLSYMNENFAVSKKNSRMWTLFNNSDLDVQKRIDSNEV